MNPTKERLLETARAYRASADKIEAFAKVLPDSLDAVLDLPVEVLGLNQRGMNACRSAGAKTLGELVRREALEMYKFNNVGRKTLQELEIKLARLGLQFGMFSGGGVMIDAPEPIFA